MATNDIIQELNQLESSLTGKISGSFYAIPAGYFDGFASTVLNRIKALGAVNAEEELSYLSPFLSAVPKELPYSVPAGYFSDLKEKAIGAIRGHADYQTAAEELESISPLLNSIGKKTPYRIPDGYFDNLVVPIDTTEKREAKVISLGSRKWLRYGVAAAIISCIALGAGLFFNTGKAVDISNTHAWVKKNMKKVSTTDINSFVQLTSQQNAAATASMKSADIKDMLKDVSDKDLQNFLTEAETAEEYSDDLFLN